MLMAKYLQQNANTKGLIFREPCKEGVDGKLTDQTLPPPGLFTHTNECNDVYVAIGYTFYYMHTFVFF